MPGKHWSADDIEILRTYSGKETFEMIGGRVSKSRQACQAKAWSLNLKGCRLGGTPKRRFSDHDLIGNAGVHAFTEIAKILKVDPTTITRHKRRLGLKGLRIGTRYAATTSYYGGITIRWTPEEMKRLREVKAARVEIPSYVGHEWLSRRSYG